MKKEVKDRWLAALRSGKYKQGKKVLRTEEGTYCCLGVLCDLAAQDGVGQWVGGSLHHWEFVDESKDDGADYSETDLTKGVREWAGLPANLFLHLPDEEVQEEWMREGVNPAVLNDEGMPFEKIASLIEEQWQADE